MTHSYNAPWRKLALAALLGLAGTTAAQAQALNYNLFGTSNTAGTYTDLGTSGTVITTPNNDDANSASTPIGFAFSFNGITFNDFILNTNGFLKLGTTAPAAPFFYTDPQAAAGGPLNTAAETNLLLPLNLDLEGTATTEYRVATTGAAGSRVTTIQWKNVSDKLPAGKQFATISFQVKLYETSNRVEFVYSSATAGPGPDGFKAAAVGIKGSGNTATTSVLVTKGSVQAWALASFVAGNYTGNAHNVRSSALPDAGRTYTFNQAVANDAAVQSIYTLGKAPVQAPQTVQAVVTNVGSTPLTNVAATLNVTGATTFSDAKIVPSLAPGASTTVTFASYRPVTVGANTITVTLPADGLNSNNTLVFAQAVTANSISYLDDTQPVTASVGVSGTTPGGSLAVRYNINSAATIGEVKLSFLASVGTTSTYQVLVYDANAAGLPNSLLYTSPTLTRPATAGVVTVPVPNTVSVNNNFFVALREVSGNVGIGYQVESPLRSNTFLFQTAAGGAWTDVNTTTLPTRLGIEVGFSSRVLSATNSQVLNRAISMYPNPTMGLVKLDVRGANAKDNLQVSVTNMLGQTVHTAALKDNFTNEVNLSNLANGMYLLKVQTGADYTVRQLTIAK